MNKSEETLVVTNDNVVIHCNGGRVFGRLDKQKEAIEEYDRAIAINPGYVESMDNRGVAYGGSPALTVLRGIF